MCNTTAALTHLTDCLQKHNVTVLTQLTTLFYCGGHLKRQRMSVLMALNRSTSGRRPVYRQTLLSLYNPRPQRRESGNAKSKRDTDRGRVSGCTTTERIPAETDKRQWWEEHQDDLHDSRLAGQLSEALWLCGRIALMLRLWRNNALRHSTFLHYVDYWHPKKSP